MVLSGQSLIRSGAVALFLAGGVSGCAVAPPSPQEQREAPSSLVVPPVPVVAPGDRVEQPTFTQIGIASWYRQGRRPKRTVNGEWPSRVLLTAAHRTLPFGTMVRVTSLRTGQSVVVRINDRGPYKRGRIIDLSVAAADRLGMLEGGISKVQLAVYSSDQPRPVPAQTAFGGAR